MKFQDFSLPEEIHKALVSMNFTDPTEIQQKAIPLAMDQRDIIAGAQTGTGKTAAFGIPILSKLIENPEAAALILAPTRELAAQILDVIRKLSSHTHHMTISMLIGGANMQGQVRSLKKNPRIIVATPGRLMDHLQQKNLDLKNIAILVLDEADRMLDMGFAPQLETILTHLPKKRQTLFFSATIPPNIESLARKYLTNPIRLVVGPINQKVEKIEQQVREVTNATKNDVLLDELNACEGSVLIFTRTKDRADRVADYLLSYGYSITRIHGDRTQGQRNQAIKSFREGKFRILVATDIVARGLDIPHIQHVINYDLPSSPEDYIHRIGRTARAGAAGRALVLLVPDDQYQWVRINKLYNQKAYEEMERKQYKDGRLISRRDERPSRPNKYGKGSGGRQAAREGERREQGGGKAKRSFFTKKPGSAGMSKWQSDDRKDAEATGGDYRKQAPKVAKKKKSSSSKKSDRDSYFSKTFSKKKSRR
jgi:ATP-dependent RNA helicase DeaD